MTANRKKQVVLLLLVIVIAGLMAVLAGGAVAQEEPEPGPPNPPVLPPHSNAFGNSYEEWAAKWWQWAYGLPATGDHPLIANHEMDCSLGQEGKVWFLGGSWAPGPDPENPEPFSFIGKAERECEVPVGKALFFPILNIQCSAFVEYTEEELLECAANPPAPVAVEYVNMWATIDGMEVDGLDDYKFPGFPPDPQEPPKYFVLSEERYMLGPLPYPNLPGLGPEYEGASALAAGNGIYLLIPPLSPGEHTIKFEGQTRVPGIYSFKLDISYDLTVVRGKK